MKIQSDQRGLSVQRTTLLWRQQRIIKTVTLHFVIQIVLQLLVCLLERLLLSSSQRFQPDKKKGRHTFFCAICEGRSDVLCPPDVGIGRSWPSLEHGHSGITAHLETVTFVEPRCIVSDSDYTRRQFAFAGVEP